MLEVIQECGISLILHSNIHNDLGIPSARIFQAAASSAIIICDFNSFVKKHFSDAVFYVVTSQSTESIFEEIQEHIMDIYLDPEKALNMAKKAHQIFMENFTMEKQLLKLEAMHKKIMSKRRQ